MFLCCFSLPGFQAWVGQVLKSQTMNEEYIIQKIKSMMPEGNITPKGVLYSRLLTAIAKDASAVLNNLYKEKKINVRKTLNDKSITIV